MTCATWLKMWHMVGGWTFSQNVSSPALTVWDRQCLEYSEQKDHLINEAINQSEKDKGVYRTALATGGLLISCWLSPCSEYYGLLQCMTVGSGVSLLSYKIKQYMSITFGSVWARAPSNNCEQHVKILKSMVIHCPQYCLLIWKN